MDVLTVLAWSSSGPLKRTLRLVGPEPGDVKGPLRGLVAAAGQAPEKLEAWSWSVNFDGERAARTVEARYHLLAGMLEHARQGAAPGRDDIESRWPGGHDRLKRGGDRTFLFQSQHTLQDAYQVRMQQKLRPS